MKRAVVCFVVLLLGITPLTASATPSADSPQRAAAAATQAGGRAAAQAREARGEYGIPAPPAQNAVGNPIPYAGGLSTVARSTKAKVSVSVAPFDILSYVNFCVATPGVFNSCCPDGTDCAAQRFFPKSSVDATGTIFWLSTKGPSWVVSPSGAPKRFGTLPSVTVRTLAFGSIPVTATIDITQSVGDDGYFRPITINYDTGSPFFPGDVVAGQAAPPNTRPDFNNYAYYPKGSFTGTVDLRIRDVTVDRTPIDVGSSCRTSRAGALALTSPAGFADTGLEATDVRGRPGGFTLNPGATLQGTLDIPAFSGCKDGARSLDPLLTSLVSSRRNPVEATVTRLIQDCTGACPPYPQAQAAAPAQRRAAAIALPARTLPVAATRIARTLRDLPARRAARLIALLPESLAKAVRADIRGR